MSSDLDRVVAVLVNDALSPLQVFLLGLLLPPVHQVTLAVQLTALVLVSFILVQSEEREDSHQTRGSARGQLPTQGLRSSCTEV